MGWCDPLEHPDPPSGEPKAKLLELFCNRCGNVMTLPPPPVFAGWLLLIFVGAMTLARLEEHRSRTSPRASRRVLFRKSRYPE